MMTTIDVGVIISRDAAHGRKVTECWPVETMTHPDVHRAAGFSASEPLPLTVRMLIASVRSATIVLVLMLVRELIRVGFLSCMLVTGRIWSTSLTSVAALCVTTRGLSELASCGDPV